MKTLVIIPAYNEEKNIEQVINDLQENAPWADCVVVNDCSTDKTKEKVKGLSIKYIDLPVNLGIGGGVQTGYRYAMEHGYDVAVQFDGDGQHDAKYLKDLIAPIEREQADVVIGSRFIEKKGYQSSAARRAGIAFLSHLICALSGIRVKDVTSGMRAVNSKAMSLFAEDYAQDYPEPEALLVCGLRGLGVAERPVQMRERQGGVSSISMLKSVYYMIKVSLSLIISRLSIRKENRK